MYIYIHIYIYLYYIICFRGFFLKHHHCQWCSFSFFLGPPHVFGQWWEKNDHAGPISLSWKTRSSHDSSGIRYPSVPSKCLTWRSHYASLPPKCPTWRSIIPIYHSRAAFHGGGPIIAASLSRAQHEHLLSQSTIIRRFPWWRSTIAASFPRVQHEDLPKTKSEVYSPWIFFGRNFKRRAFQPLIFRGLLLLVSGSVLLKRFSVVWWKDWLGFICLRNSVHNWSQRWLFFFQISNSQDFPSYEICIPEPEI